MERKSGRLRLFLAFSTSAGTWLPPPPRLVGLWLLRAAGVLAGNALTGMSEKVGDTDLCWPKGNPAREALGCGAKTEDGLA